MEQTRRTVLRTLYLAAGTGLAGCSNKPAPVNTPIPNATGTETVDLPELTVTKRSTMTEVDDTDWTPTPTDTPAAMTPFEASHYDALPHPEKIEQHIHDLTNRAREAHDLDTVEWNDELAYVARNHSRDMGVRGFYSHTNPDGEGPDDRRRKYNLQFRTGENIALLAEHEIEDKTYEEIAEVFFEKWKHSTEGHWQNILDDDWTDEGVGVYIIEEGSTFATQLFGAPK